MKVNIVLPLTAVLMSCMFVSISESTHALSTDDATGPQKVSIDRLDNAKIHVIDAKSRKPIQNVRYLFGYWEYGEESYQNFLWDSDYILADGVLSPSPLPEPSYPYTYSNGYYRFMAEGYPTKTIIDSATWNPETQRYEIALEPASAEPIRLTVLLPDGTPARQTDIAVVTKFDWEAANGWSQMPSSARRFRTNDNGKVALFCESKDDIVAIHDKGIIRRSADKIDEIQELHFVSWGKIEGCVKEGQKSVAEGTVHLSQNGRKVKVDSEGKFIFEKVLPGNSVTLEYTRQQGIMSGGKSISITPLPGQTTVANIGGQGIPVTGRIVFPDASIKRQATSGYQTSIRLLPTSQQRKGEGGVEQFHRTTGNFRFPDIEPGEYRIYVTIGGYRTASDTVVKIPKPNQGTEAEEHDLGVIEFNLLRR